MQMRYRYVTCRYREGSPKQIAQHYRQLLSDALRHNQQPLIHRSDLWRPAADILESPEMLRVNIELAGMRENEIEVTLYEDALVISGERQNLPECHEEGWSYHEAQIRYGPFRIEVYITTPLIQEAVVARYEHGILSVDLPKVPLNESNQTPILEERTSTNG